MEMPNEEMVREQLKEVYDPELGMSIVDLGLVYDVEVEGTTVKVTYTLTTPACPLGPMIEGQIRDLVMNLPGVKDVVSELTFSPPWDPRTMASDEIKMQLGFW